MTPPQFPPLIEGGESAVRWPPRPRGMGLPAGQGFDQSKSLDLREGTPTQLNGLPSGFPDASRR